MTNQPAEYILASKRNGTLYIGVTANLVQRIWQHRNDIPNMGRPACTRSSASKGAMSPGETETVAGYWSIVIATTL